MAITIPTGPAGGRELVAQNVAEILESQSTSAGGLLKDLRAAELAIADPHRCYFVSLEDLIAGRLLEAAEPVSWRYLLIQRNSALAEAELTEVSKRKLEFNGLHQSPFSNATLIVLRIAEKLPEVQKRDYELRYLKIPSVYLAAVWLHRKDDNLLMPLIQPPGGLQENRPYSEKEVLKALRPVAKKAKEFGDSFEKNQGKRSRR